MGPAFVGCYPQGLAGAYWLEGTCLPRRSEPRSTLTPAHTAPWKSLSVPWCWHPCAQPAIVCRPIWLVHQSAPCRWCHLKAREPLFPHCWRTKGMFLRLMGQTHMVLRHPCLCSVTIPVCPWQPSTVQWTHSSCARCEALSHSSLQPCSSC